MTLYGVAAAGVVALQYSYGGSLQVCVLGVAMAHSSLASGAVAPADTACVAPEQLEVGQP